MTTRAPGVQIDGHNYVLVNDHETYVVKDVPSQPDSDPRMERRVVYDSVKGINHRREANAVDTQNSMFTSAYTRQTRAGEGIYWANGCDTRTLDRIFAQRLTTQATQSPAINGGSYYRALFDGQNGASIAVSDYDISNSVAIVAGAQTVARRWDLTGGRLLGTPGTPNADIWGTTAPTWATTNRSVTDAIMYAGRVYVGACATATNTSEPGSLQVDYTQPQRYVVWDGNNANIPLEAPVPYASPDNIVSITPSVAGTTTYTYFIVATDATGKQSAQSQVITTVKGPDNLSTATQIALVMPAAFPAGMGGSPVFKLYRSTTTLKSQFDMRGLIATTTTGATVQDTGVKPTAEYAPITPGFAVGDVGLATAFVVIRDVLWRAAGAQMWAWHGVNTGIQNAQGNWSATQRIGDPNSPITALDVFEDDLVIFKPDGLWTMDRGGNVFPLFPGVNLPGLHPRPLGQWRGNYYFAADYGMVWEWDGDKINNIGFDRAEPYPMGSGVLGIPNASTRGIPLPNFLLVGFNQALSSSNTGYVLAFDGTMWHPFHYDPLHRVTALGIGGVSQIPAYPVLQIGKGSYDKTTCLLHFLDKPTLDPLLSTSYSTLAQDIYFPVDNGIIGDAYKVMESVRAYVENAHSGTVRFSYSLDENIQAQSFVIMGAPQADRQFIQTFQLTNPLPLYRKNLLKMTITPDSTAGSPIVRTVVVRYKQREFQRRAWEVVLFLEQGQLLNTRSKDARSSQKMLDDLNKARATAKLVLFKDILGAEHMVYVESVGETVKTYANNNKLVSLTCRVTMVEPSPMGGPV